MKLFKKFILFAAAISALASCQKDGLGTSDGASATIPAINGFASPWSEGEYVRAYSGKFQSGIQMKLSGVSSDGLKATIKDADGSTYTVAYPMSDGISYTTAAVKATIPSSQKAVAGSYDKDAVFAFAKGSSAFNFNYAVAFVSFTLDSDDVASVTLSASCALAGSGTYAVSSSAAKLNSVDGVNSLTMTGVKKGVKYAFVVFPQNYSTLSLSCTMTDGSVKSTNCAVSSLSLEGGDVKYLGLIKVVDHTSVKPGAGQVAGTVKYSDGSYAKGVTVSDGFNVAVTDEWGEYLLDICSDTWYIYVSYPADAKITSSGGCPNFFQKYSVASQTYDFTFDRITPETDFALFAMADPQAHYAARGTQKKADTDRFLQETVPSLNKDIAAQGIPCYGVTLGDIVYSEGSRNSNPGMAKMASHFSNVNMPVFQTMGNHDFTYFYGSSNPLKTDASSSTLQLKSQRMFEDTFGPINFSFNRGDVHVVCMKDVYYDSDTDASDYHCGFTTEQYKWLQADLANVSKDKMVILCVHIPIAGNSSKDNVTNVLNLVKQYKNATVFSGHTHYYRGYANTCSTGMYEHIHSAVCGQWWWSKMEGDGCPNGYTIYHMSGPSIKDAYFTGFNDQMNTRDYQIRMYRGNLKTGGSYAYFQWPHNATTLLINVFSGDSRWKVQVYEDDVLSGTATLMSNSKTKYDSVTKGQTYTVPAASNQDWWAIGYHIGVVGRGTSSTSYYTNMFHMFKYELKSATSKVKVVATDPYGNQYTCTEIMSTLYPDYVKIPQ